MIWEPRHQRAIAALGVALLLLALWRWWGNTAVAPEPGKALVSADTNGLGLKLDPNTATQDELGIVPGIGKSRAREIIRARKAGLRFSTLEDLDQVKSIGESSLERAKPFLVFPAPTPAP